MEDNDSSKSGLKLYSLGIVIETKPEATDFILVSPVESLNIQETGSIKEHKKDFKGDQQDLQYTSFKSEHESKSYIRAKWIPYGHSNRITAPDVAANETVLIFKYNNVDEYYWTTIFREPQLRKLEEVMYGYSNISNSSVSEDFDETKSYWVKISTRNKYIKLHTSKNDGEATEYDLFIDTKKGVFQLKDDLENSVEIDSTAGKVYIIAKQEIYLKAPKVITESDNGKITLDSSGVNAKGTTTNINDTIVTGSSYVDISAPQTSMQNVKVNGTTDTSSLIIAGAPHS